MRQPESWSQLCAWTLCLIGGAFVLLGAIWGILGLPVRNGTSWSFLPVGLALLLIGLGFALAARQWSRKQARLLAEGVPVPGEIEKVRHEVFVTWNRDGFTNWPGKNSPWTVRCRYQWEGCSYTVVSGFMWLEPAPGEQCPVVYVDPNCPRLAFVDADTIRCRA